MNELYHHGIKGQKWGVRRFQNYDGTRIKPIILSDGDRILRKGTYVSRVTNSKSDPTFDNKKYVSINADDHKKWQDYIGKAYNRSGIQAYNVYYRTAKDVKVAHYTKVGKMLAEKALSDPNFGKQVLRDTNFAMDRLGQNPSDWDTKFSLNFAMQTATGKYLVNELINRGYGAVEDVHGRNVSNDPLIILDPDKNLKRLGSTRYKDK